MEKEKYFIVMVKLNMMVILQMINVMDKENKFGKMEIIIQDIGLMVLDMEKVQYIQPMDI